jgi:ABC-type Zn uptake system ZnuABC Zn-binding protein ZnuA
MRKITFLFAVCVTLTLAACGSGSAANQTTDSTAVKADSTVQDSTAAPVATDSTAK